MRTRTAAIVALVLLMLPSEAPAQRLTTADVFISAESAIDLVGAPGVTFLHVGTNEAAYEEGHLEQAQFLPLSDILVEHDGIPAELPPIDRLTALFESYGMPGNGRVVIYSDASLGDMEALAAARAYLTLDVLGHPYVNIVDGGLAALVDAGAGLSTEPASGQIAELDLGSPNDNLIVDSDYVHEHGAHVLLTDNRPPAQFSGEDPGPDIERPGHIPGAVNLFWKDFLDEKGLLKPIDELAQMWEDAGHTAGTEVVTYCRTGMQASYGYAVAKHLGLDVKMYDGSYIDWSNHSDHPVVFETQ